jgi:hypothetical protein
MKHLTETEEKECAKLLEDFQESMDYFYACADEIQDNMLSMRGYFSMIPKRDQDIIKYYINDDLFQAIKMAKSALIGED